MCFESYFDVVIFKDVIMRDCFNCVFDLIKFYYLMFLVIKGVKTHFVH
jgi:hypothetical protein